MLPAPRLAALRPNRPRPIRIRVASLGVRGIWSGGDRPVWPVRQHNHVRGHLLNVRILFQVAAVLAAMSPLAAQAPEGCWSLSVSDWEWTVYRRDPGEPTYPPSESAVRFVPELFRLLDAVSEPQAERPASDRGGIDVVLPAAASSRGSWRLGPSFLGLSLAWSTPDLYFGASFPDFDPELDSIVGLAAEDPYPRMTHHGVPGWKGVATLVRRPCASAGAL